MTNETLAQYANLAVYSAMAVFTLAMIAFALDLAGAAPRVLALAPLAEKEPALAGVVTPANATCDTPADAEGNAPAIGPAKAPGPGERGDDADRPRTRKAAGVAGCSSG